jgi:hypothetical protein
MLTTEHHTLFVVSIGLIIAQSIPKTSVIGTSMSTSPMIIIFIVGGATVVIIVIIVIHV